jgi:tetratricopeptide (TPR) repeat protein
MDILHYKITTSVPDAQKYFDQGLLLAYAFNHAEAARSFYHATRLDPSCAMCYWGYAYVLGPNYNAGMEPDNYQRAYDAIQKAIELSTKATAKEKALITAMSKRYVREPVEKRDTLDAAYMRAMKAVHRVYPEDVDIAAMYAESLMDMHPWDLWEQDGRPKPWTHEIVEAIEHAISIDPKHPGGHHFYIHAVEASPNPEKALPSAKAFDDGLVPRAGHLVHMPSHIYINTGHYHLVSLANIKAVELDSSYVTQCHAQGVYPLAYYPHNYHFLAATATLEGNSKWALEAADKMADQTNHKGMLLAPLATLQHYNSIPYFVKVKFERWDDILRMPLPDSALIYPRGVYHYARGMAYLGKKDLVRAQSELNKLMLVNQEDTLKALTIWGFNSMHQILTIAQKVLAGELAAKQGRIDEGVRLLRDAVKLEDQLLYQEPPDWFFSVRHHLGALLLEAKRNAEAITVFIEDLRIFPNNGWALNGLEQAYRANKQADKAREVEKQFREAWAHADVKLTSSKIN